MAQAEMLMKRAILCAACLALLVAGAGCDQDDGYNYPTDTSSDPSVDDGVTPPDVTTDPTEDPPPGDPTEDPAADPPVEDGGGGDVDPPFHGTSGGTGGGPANGETRTTAEGGITYRIIAPSGSGPFPVMIIYSGTEGGATMTTNIQSIVGAGAAPGISGYIFGILDGVTYYGNGNAGAYVLDHIRGMYDVDNDRTYLLSESAGTSAGLQLGLNLRQTYFAAYWANDVNASGTPTLNASEIGFAPYGNAGPGGDWPDANAIVAGMEAAGYRCPPPAPYDGPGSGTHGHPDQFVAALNWFPGKTRL